MMSSAKYACPQCWGSFHWGDGYLDLLGHRLCSYSCRQIWITTRYSVNDVEEAPTPQAGNDEKCQQVADGRESSPRQFDDLVRLKSSNKQME